MENRIRQRRTVCKVINCGTGNDDPTASFFALPTQVSRKEEWCRRLKIQLSDSCFAPKICGKHFEPSQFRNTSIKKRLIKNALPFIPSGLVQNKSLVDGKQTGIIVNNKPNNVPAESCLAPQEVNSVKTIQASHIKRIATCVATSVSFQKTRSQVEPPGFEPIRILPSEVIVTQSGAQLPLVIPFQQSESLKPPQIQQPRSPHPFLQSKLLTTRNIQHRHLPSSHQQLGLPALQEKPGLSIAQQAEKFELPISHQFQQTDMKFLISQQIQPPAFSILQPIQQQGLPMHQKSQPPILLTPQLIPNSPAQPLQLVFTDMGINGIHCFTQVQVSQPSQLQPNPEILPPIIDTKSHLDNVPHIFLSSLSNLILQNQNEQVNIDERETIECDPTKQCLMCNGKVNSISSVKDMSESYILIIKNVFEILNLNSMIEDFNIDPNEAPFCIACLRQVNDMVKVHDEITILTERFEILKIDVIYSLISSFCQRKGIDNEDELGKDFYKNADTFNKMINLLGPKSRVRPTPIIACGFPENEDIVNKPSFVFQCDTGYSDTLDFETLDFELEDTEGFNTNFILSHSPDPLTIPIEDIGKVEICFKGKGGVLRQKEKWEALSKCPDTKEGLEMLLPCQYRRIICPICKKKVTPLKMSKHLKLFHPGRKDIAEIESKLLSESTKTIRGKERKKLMKAKWKKLSNYTKKHNKNEAGSHIPILFRKMNCPICNKEVTANSIASHVNIHTGEKPFKCSKCPKAFARKSNLSTHRFVHLKKNPFRNNFYFCDLCSDGGKLWELKCNYVRHVLKAHSTHVGVNDVLYFYNCDAKDCVHSYRQKDQFLRHIKSHGDVFTCQHGDCGKVFADSVNYESHCTLFHTTHTGKESGRQDGELFDCKYCPLISKDKNEWEIHELTHGIDMSTEQKTHLCEECGAGFKTYLLLWVHKRYNHKRSLQEPMEKIPKPKPKKCLSGVKLQNLKINYAFKTCQVCEKRFYARSLTTHLLDTHTYENRLYCYICKQTFKNITYLESHIRRHLGLPRKTSKEKCTSCSNEYPSIITLRKHCVQEHSEQYLAEKPFYCPVCWCLFGTEEEGTTHHLKFHEQWRCKVCGKQLRNKYVYEHHVKIHTGETPYECKVCQKRFIILGNCKEHEMRHFGEKPFYCEFCNKGFFRKKLLRTHIEIEHSIG